MVAAVIRHHQPSSSAVLLLTLTPSLSPSPSPSFPPPPPQVADAARATLGLDIAACVVTPRPVGVTVAVSASGASWGSVGDTASLVEGARVLVKEMGCTAVAVVVRFPEDDEGGKELFEAYRQVGGGWVVVVGSG